MCDYILSLFQWQIKLVAIGTQQLTMCAKLGMYLCPANSF